MLVTDTLVSAREIVVVHLMVPLAQDHQHYVCCSIPDVMVLQAICFRKLIVKKQLWCQLR